MSPRPAGRSRPPRWTSSGLVDGTLTATPTFTVPGQPAFVGATLTIAKDVVAPAAPVASPPGGTYKSRAQGGHARR